MLTVIYYYNAIIVVNILEFHLSILMIIQYFILTVLLVVLLVNYIIQIT